MAWHHATLEAGEMVPYPDGAELCSAIPPRSERAGCRLGKVGGRGPVSLPRLDCRAPRAVRLHPIPVTCIINSRE